MVQYLNTFEEYQQALQNHLIVVIDFTATWCGPCQMISPEYESMAEVYSKTLLDIAFYKVDVDKSEDISTHCQVNCMPTFQMYIKGQLTEKSEGANLAPVQNKIQMMLDQFTQIDKNESKES